MKNVYLKNILVLGLILLFIGVGIQPAFAEVSIESDNSEMIKVTVEFYETDRTYKHTVLFTQEQAEELKNLINDFKIQLENADNKIETEDIYKDTVKSLNDYDILPEGIGIEKVQRLVTGKEHNPVVVNLFERWYRKNQNSMGDNENILCLIAADGFEDWRTAMGRIILTITKHLRNSLMITLHNIIKQYPTFQDFIYDLVTLIDIVYFPFIQPLGFGCELFFGSKWVKRNETKYFPCQGNIISVGLNGITSYKGDFYGQLPLSPAIGLWPGYYIYYDYSGAIGYTGIRLILRDPEEIEYVYLLGSALWFKIGEEPPS